jgi:hypothetical protein
MIHRTTHATRTAARSIAAISNPPSGVPWNPAKAGSPEAAESRPNQVNLVTNTATSAASNAANSHGLGRARANHGSSHSPYWGE